MIVRGSASSVLQVIPRRSGLPASSTTSAGHFAGRLTTTSTGLAAEIPPEGSPDRIA